MRLRKRAAERGLDSFEPHEMLELLLFQSIRRSNTNETAHMLLGDAGSLAALLRELPEKLTRVKGVGTASARLLSSVIPSFSRAMTDALRNGKPLSRWSLLAAADFRLNAAGEAAAVLLLSENGALLEWIAAKDTKSLLSIAAAVRGRIRSRDGAEEPAACAVLLGESAADALIAGCSANAEEGFSPSPVLRALFPDVSGLYLMRSDRRMEDL